MQKEAVTFKNQGEHLMINGMVYYSQEGPGRSLKPDTVLVIQSCVGRNSYYALQIVRVERDGVIVSINIPHNTFNNIPWTPIIGVLGAREDHIRIGTFQFSGGIQSDGLREGEFKLKWGYEYILGVPPVDQERDLSFGCEP
jgi:hypothetical protein